MEVCAGLCKRLEHTVAAAADWEARLSASLQSRAPMAAFLKLSKEAEALPAQLSGASELSDALAAAREAEGRASLWLRQIGAAAAAAGRVTTRRCQAGSSTTAAAAGGDGAAPPPGRRMRSVRGGENGVVAAAGEAAGAGAASAVAATRGGSGGVGGRGDEGDSAGGLDRSVEALEVRAAAFISGQDDGITSAATVRCLDHQSYEDE